MAGSKLKSILRPWLIPVKRLLLLVNRTIAFLLRQCVSPLEKIVPSLGRKMRNWGWIWQPGFSHRNINKFFEGQEDPFNFASPYEMGKYKHSMSFLNGKTHERALEIGAAEGIFTELLAPYCKSLLAIEIADIAVERANERLSKFDNVTFVKAAIPNDMPQGKFDLIVASDVLVYFPKDVLLKVISDLENALEPGGILFCLHYMGDIGAAILGRDVHALIKERKSWDIEHEEAVENVGPRNKGYTVLILKKPDIT